MIELNVKVGVFAVAAESLGLEEVEIDRNNRNTEIIEIDLI